MTTEHPPIRLLFKFAFEVYGQLFVEAVQKCWGMLLTAFAFVFFLFFRKYSSLKKAFIKSLALSVFVFLIESVFHILIIGWLLYRHL